MVDIFGLCDAAGEVVQMENSIGAARFDNTQFFVDGSSHVKISLRRLPQARVIWVNKRAVGGDPAFVECGKRLDLYREHLLESCAYVIDDGVNTLPSEVYGFADRYGGTGIGNNGGSGRAAVINNYLVKGIGRTPLVSHLTDPAHASGGAYLEECVREVVFSEIASAEFPFGSVPVFGIIDTGLFVVWNLSQGPRVERRCLLIRPVALRPAHFERARAFISSDPCEGYIDSLRVRFAYDTAISAWGIEGMLKLFSRFWISWAEQLAYGFIHRMAHGSDSTSNVSLGGELLDFGSMTAVPTLARYDLSWGVAAFGCELDSILSSLARHSKQMAQYSKSGLSAQVFFEACAPAISSRYHFVLLRELLRLLGLSRAEAERVLIADPDLARSANNVISHFKRERLAMFDTTPLPALGWDLGDFWDRGTHGRLAAIRRLVVESLRSVGIDFSVGYKTRIDRNRMRCTSRPALYRSSIKQDLYNKIELGLGAEDLKQESLDQIISGVVCANRRDESVELEGFSPVGFARNGSCGYIIFRREEDSRHFAWREWGGDELGSVRAPQCVAVKKITNNEIIFVNSLRSRFRGAVLMC